MKEWKRNREIYKVRRREKNRNIEIDRERKIKEKIEKEKRKYIMCERGKRLSQF